MMIYRWDAVDPYARWTRVLPLTPIRAQDDAHALRIAARRVERSVRAEPSYWAGGDDRVPVSIEIYRRGRYVDGDTIVVRA